MPLFNKELILFFVMKKLILIILFFLFLPLDLAFSFVALNRLSQSQKMAPVADLQPQDIDLKKFPAQVYAALPATVGQIYSSVQESDARPLILTKYLEKYHSEMKPYNQVAAKIIAVSDEQGLDWRLLVAIAQQESNLGKRMPPNCYNAWGYGIHSRGTLCFDNWEQGIETVARGLKEKYLNEGLITPEEIMGKYTPLSSGSWAAGVSQFLEDLRFAEVE